MMPQRDSKGRFVSGGGSANNMGSISIQVEITDNSPEVLEAVKIACLRALHTAGEDVRAKAWQNAPYRTGNLANSITHETHGMQEIIGTNVEYALAHELGSSRGTRPKHYLKNAIANNDNIKTIFEESLKNV